MPKWSMDVDLELCIGGGIFLIAVVIGLAKWLF